MLPRGRLPRLLLALAAISLLVIVAAYLLGPPVPRPRAWIADVAWTWTALYGVAGCALAWARVPRSGERAAWGWFGLGCAAFLAGQLVWNYDELGRGVRPPYPSLADAAVLSAFVCLFVAAVRLPAPYVSPPSPRRPLGRGLAIDSLLVTFTAGALAYEFLLEPLFDQGGPLLPVLASMAWSTVGVAVLWLIFVRVLRGARLPLEAGSATFVLVGLVVLCVANLAYARTALRGTFVPGGPLDLGWDVGFLLIGAAAVLAAEPAADRPRAAALPPDRGSEAARLVVLLIGVAGIIAIAVRGALSTEPEPDAAVVVAVGGMIIAVRFALSVRADRHYAALLEREVAAQTRTLMDSLGAAAAAERNLRLVMEAVPDAIVVLDREGHVLDLNVPVQDLVPAPAGTRQTPRELGRTVFEFLDADGARLVRQNLDAAFAGEVRRFEVPFVRHDRTRGVSAMLYAPVREGGQVSRVLALARDVTDTRRTEAQLQQAEKLTAMGQLVSGVAHEINNPAAIISGFAQTLMLEGLQPDHREMVKMIYDEATRIGRITSNLLAFARAGGKDRNLVDLNDIVHRTFALRSYHLTTLNIAISLELDPSDPKVWGNGSELQQILLNLMINAEQALTGVDGQRAIVLRTIGLDTEVLIECADTGPGVAPEIRGQIFDPFFTTKPEGVGTGLGLSICYGIVQDHGGRIRVDAAPGGGALFAIALPRDPRTHARATSGPHRQPAEAEEPLSVLLIDDEAGLRQAVARFLSRRGIQVRAVGDGGEALAALESARFDAIISDVRMPGVGGGEFLARLRDAHPELVPTLIFSTGDSFAPETAALLKESGVPALVKPFDFAKLEKLIRQTASASAAAAARARSRKG
ncbi:MAG: ATP-binding protein [Gemmatimonadales bacterium]